MNPALRNRWQSIWRAPGASELEHRRHEARRLHLLCQQAPLTLLTTGGILLAARWLDWGGGVGDGLLALWSLALVTGMSLMAWMGWRYGRTLRSPVGRGPIRWLAASLLLSAACYGVGEAYLLATQPPGVQILVMAVTVAYQCGGSWLFSPHPLAGMGWTLGGGLGLMLALPLLSHETWALVLVALALPFMLFQVLLVARAGIQQLTLFSQQDELARQRQMVSLLLRDFESDSSDWLWELDVDGRLRHVSVHLAQATKQPIEGLLGQPFVAVLGRLGAQGLEGLQLALRQPQAFSDLLISSQGSSARHWWSLKARPLFGDGGEWLGWRGVASDVTALQQHEEELTRLATIDSLTGLANRYRFYQCLSQRLPGGCAVLLIDVDHFNEVNDSLGHATGDLLVRALASRWLPLIRTPELLARLGGDEFALLSPQPSLEHAQRLCERLMQGVREPLQVNDHLLHVSVSIGIAIAPEHAGDAETLLRRADMALYAAKAAGRARGLAFHPDMEASAQRRVRLTSELRQAIQQGSLFNAYQPKVDLASGRLLGFEALVRWRHPRLGMVSPADFIALAEESGLILPLGEAVLRQACLDACNWPEGIGVAVNLSAVQIERSDIGSLVRQVLADTGLAAQRLELELTETAFVNGSQRMADLLGELRALGVRVALDDFGTGYSSLAYLQALPLDTLKIDSRFVRELEPGQAKSAAIVQTIVQLAQAIGATTVAEGVETPAQQAQLLAMGCEIGQGFLFSRPLAIGEVQLVIQRSQDSGWASAYPSSSAWMGLP